MKLTREYVNQLERVEVSVAELRAIVDGARRLERALEEISERWREQAATEPGGVHVECLGGCGVDIFVDEDGCCRGCGADATWTATAEEVDRVRRVKERAQ